MSKNYSSNSIEDKLNSLFSNNPLKISKESVSSIKNKDYLSINKDNKVLEQLKEKTQNAKVKCLSPVVKSQLTITNKIETKSIGQQLKIPTQEHIRPKYSVEDEKLINKTVNFDYAADAYEEVTKNKEKYEELIRKENNMKKKQQEAIMKSRILSRDKAADDLIQKINSKKIENKNEEIEKLLNKKRTNDSKYDFSERKSVPNNNKNVSCSELKAKLKNALQLKSDSNNLPKSNGIIKTVKPLNNKVNSANQNLHKAEVSQKYSDTTENTKKISSNKGANNQQISQKLSSVIASSSKGNIKENVIKRNEVINIKEDKVVIHNKSFDKKESQNHSGKNQSNNNSKQNQKSITEKLNPKINKVVASDSKSINPVTKEKLNKALVEKNSKEDFRKKLISSIKTTSTQLVNNKIDKKSFTPNSRNISMYLDDYEDEDDYEDDGFIVSDDYIDPVVAKELEKMRKSKQRNYIDDGSDIEEVGYEQIDKEEALSRRIAAQEDYDEYVKEQKSKNKLIK